MRCSERTVARGMGEAILFQVADLHTRAKSAKTWPTLLRIRFAKQSVLLSTSNKNQNGGVYGKSLRWRRAFVCVSVCTSVLLDSLLVVGKNNMANANPLSEKSDPFQVADLHTRPRWTKTWPTLCGRAVLCILNLIYWFEFFRW